MHITSADVAAWLTKIRNSHTHSTCPHPAASAPGTSAADGVYYDPVMRTGGPGTFPQSPVAAAASVVQVVVEVDEEVMLPLGTDPSARNGANPELNARYMPMSCGGRCYAPEC